MSQFTDSPIVEAGAFIDGTDPNSVLPTLLWLGEASGIADIQVNGQTDPNIVVAVAQAPDLIIAPITTYTLLRATAASGPWTQVDERLPSPLSRWQNLFDLDPIYGQRAYYAVVVDGSRQSSALYFVAHAAPAPIVAAGTISAGAFGPYPLLGSDVMLNPITGEAVIGPNGDMLSVNGLQCLAQDLRTRFLTTQGELLLHPDFGMTRERIIGSGQANASAEAQFLQARFIDTILAEPRVLELVSMVISRPTFDSWLIDFSIVAIGVEGPQRLNLVFPYYSS